MELNLLIITQISISGKLLLRVKGVGDVFTRADPFGMRIWLNPDKLADLNLTPSDVIQAVQEQNVQVAAGTVGSPPQAELSGIRIYLFCGRQAVIREGIRENYCKI